MQQSTAIQVPSVLLLLRLEIANPPHRWTTPWLGFFPNQPTAIQCWPQSICHSDCAPRHETDKTHTTNVCRAHTNAL
jgi:hypothetical protein